MPSHSKKSSKVKLKNFSSFTLAEAFNQLGIERLQEWSPAVNPVQASDFFQERLRRLKRFFDLRSYEESKKLLIDAICEEALEPTQHLKIWKGAALKGDRTTGNVDYLVAENKAYLDAPFLCIIEAKKDDFEQGLAQCLVEMQACQWKNQQRSLQLDIFGIVTNGDTWQFYCLETDGKVKESLPYAIGELEIVLGFLRYLTETCDRYFVDKSTSS